MVQKKSLRGGAEDLSCAEYLPAVKEGGWSSAALQRPLEPKVPVKRWLAAELYLLLGNAIEPALQFRVMATKLAPVKTKETRNSFMYGTRHLQPR